ncbi:MAG: matrixin family metalloprotease, partial [Pirellulales bacterium]
MGFAELLGTFGRGSRPRGGRRPRRWRGRRGRRPTLETLESRTLLDASGAIWGTAPHLTLSFAPDGTEIAGESSELFATFDAVASEEAWQETILRAFQTWAVHTNADIGVVDDGGQPFGTAGPTRRDDRFGDIRIGAIPMDPTGVAISIPSDGVVGGTWVGDVLINSDAGLQNLDDLFSVVLHEAGHVFGLDHSVDPLSPMYVDGISGAIELTAGDITALQSLFGVRAPDINEADDGGVGRSDNNSLQNATELVVPQVAQLPDGSAPSIVYGDIQDTQDADFFVIETPSGYTGPITFQLRSRGISLLAPRLTVFNADEIVVDSVDGNATGGDVVTVQVPQSLLGDKVFLQVSSAQGGLVATGGYSLVVTFDATLAFGPSEIDAVAGGAFRFLGPEELEKFFTGDDGDGDDEDDDPPLFGDDLH